MIGSLVRRSSLLALALVPTLAIAAPRRGKKPKRPAATTTRPAEAAEPPAPTPDPADEPASAEAASGTSAPTPAPASPAASTPAAAGTASAQGAPAPGGDASASPDADVDTLRQEYLSLRDELFQSRARASTVASQLYSTRIQIKLTYTTARFYSPTKASIRLDGASVYENVSGAIGGDDGIRFDGYIAPGRHLISFRVEATGKDDETFTSATEAQIVVHAVPGKDLLVAARAKDGGDIAYAWKRSQRGSYALGLDVAVKTLARAVAAGARK